MAHGRQKKCLCVCLFVQTRRHCSRLLATEREREREAEAKEEETDDTREGKEGSTACSGHFAETRGERHSWPRDLERAVALFLASRETAVWSPQAAADSHSASDSRTDVSRKRGGRNEHERVHLASEGLEE